MDGREAAKNRKGYREVIDFWMMSQSVARQLEEACIRIGNDIADDDGFSPIRNLLSRFHTSLIARPLLVEGMLATVEESSDAGTASRWAVLIDDERYKVSESSLREESSRNPLPSRIRNTIAHELVHSLAFRPTEFGLQLVAGAKDAKSAAQLVETIERETERLSPLLLFSEKALKRLLTFKQEKLTANDLTTACREFGVSRYVLINRLRLLRSNDRHGFLEHKCLRNVGIGLAEWKGDGALVRSWPLFMNFDRNITPDLLLAAIEQDRTSASVLGVPESSLLCGGDQESVTFECEGKVKFASKGDPMTVRCSVESRARSGDCLFVIAKLS